MGKTEVKEWTVMVFMAADNDLDSAAVRDLKEMKQVGSTDQVSVLAQIDRANDRGAKRYHIKKGGKLQDDMIGNLGRTNTGDPAVLQEFLEFCIETYPSKHYLAVIWNHGEGWMDPAVESVAVETSRFNTSGTNVALEAGRLRTVSDRFRDALFRSTIDKAIHVEAIAEDETSKDFLDNEELRKVLANISARLGRKLDVVGLDACLMNMVEIAYQLRDAVELLVGSEETEPTDGWPYDMILDDLTARPEMKPYELASLIVRRFVASYSRLAVTQSACDLSQSEAIAEKVDTLAKLLVIGVQEGDIRQAVQRSRKQVQIFDKESNDYIDLYDFCYLLRKNVTAGEVRSACSDIMRVIEDQFVFENRYQGNSKRNSNGVSIYFPLNKRAHGYSDLDFSRRTSWDDFLQALLNRL